LYGIFVVKTIKVKRTWRINGRYVVKIAILSDVHENYHNLLLCIEDMRKEGIDSVLFLGDFMNAGIARTLATASFPVFAILGNNDGDLIALYKESIRADSTLELHPRTYADVTLGGRRFFLTHYDDLVEMAVASELYDAVFFGHTHRHSLEKRGNCMVVNPGELSAHKYGKPTYAIVDSVKNEYRIQELEGGVTVRTEPVVLAYQKLGFDSHFGFVEPAK